MAPEWTSRASPTKTSGARTSASAPRGNPTARLPPARRPSRRPAIESDAGKDINNSIEVDSGSDSDDSWHSAIDIRSPSPPPVDPTPRLTAQRRRDQLRARDLARAKHEVIDIADSSSASDSGDEDGMRFLGTRDPKSFLKRKRTSRDGSGSGGSSGSRARRSVPDTEHRDHGMSIRQSMLSFAMPSGPAFAVPVLQVDVRDRSPAEGIAVEEGTCPAGGSAMAGPIDDAISDVSERIDGAAHAQGLPQGEASGPSGMHFDPGRYSDARPDNERTPTTSDTSWNATPYFGRTKAIEQPKESCAGGATGFCITTPIPHTALWSNTTSSRSADKRPVVASRPQRRCTPPVRLGDEDLSDHDGSAAPPDHHDGTLSPVRARPLTPPLLSPSDQKDGEFKFDRVYHAHRLSASPRTASGSRARPTTPPGPPRPLSSPRDSQRPLTPPGLPPHSKPSERHGIWLDPGPVVQERIDARIRSRTPHRSPAMVTTPTQPASPTLRHPLIHRPQQLSGNRALSLQAGEGSSREGDLGEDLRAREKMRMTRRSAARSDHDEVEQEEVQRPSQTSSSQTRSSDPPPARDMSVLPGKPLLARISGQDPCPPTRARRPTAHAASRPLIARISSTSSGQAVESRRTASPVPRSAPSKPSLAQRMTPRNVQQPGPSVHSVPTGHIQPGPRSITRHSSSEPFVPSRPVDTQATSASPPLPAQIGTLERRAHGLVRKNSHCLDHVEITTSGVHVSVHETIRSLLTPLGAHVVRLDDPRLYSGRPALQGNRFVVMQSKKDPYPAGLVVAKRIDYVDLLDLLDYRRARETHAVQRDQCVAPVGHPSKRDDRKVPLERPRRPLFERMGQSVLSPGMSAGGPSVPTQLSDSTGGVPLAARLGTK